jgi:hypothetical protein
LYEFFHEVTKPFDPGRSATPPTPKEIQELLRATEGYGYWMGSPEENAAIGLVAPSEQKQVPVFANPKPKVDWRALQQAAVLRTIK